MARITIGLGLLALAACSPAQEQRNAATPAESPTVANAAAIGAPAPAHDDPPLDNTAAEGDGAPARFVGRWAANPELCRDGAWRFEEKHLATAGEVSCDFDRVTHVADGYDVAARCLAEGVTSEEAIRLRFADTSDAMYVESKTFRAITLERCRE